MEIQRSVVVSNKYGLHARASTRLAQVAGQFRAEVRLTSEEAPDTVDAKSILEVMSMGAEKGHELTVTVRGADAEQAMAAILRLFEERFGEE